MHAVAAVFPRRWAVGEFYAILSVKIDAKTRPIGTKSGAHSEAPF